MKLKTIVTDKLNTIQRRVADYLNGKAELLSRQQLKVCLVVFVVLFVAASVLAVMDSFHDAIAKPAAVKPLPVLKEKQQMNDPLLQRIHAFKIYMDSIHKNNRVQYDSIIHARPKLMDSINAIEKIF